MTKFYTHFTRRGNKILEIGYQNGEKYHRKIHYCPTVYLPSETPTGWKTLTGQHVKPKELDSMSQAKLLSEKYDNLDNFETYGTMNHAYAYINETYPDEIAFDPSVLRVANIDIEVGSENGFPEPDLANEPITAITFKMRGRYYVFGCGEYTNTREDVKWIPCDNEKDLILNFLDLWSKKSPDILTGWNVQFFDVPYLYNRISKVFSEKTAARLSPWGYVGERTTTIFNKQVTAFDLTGISILDYLELYKKFTYSNQESYRLDHIAYVELGERKLEYAEYDNLHQLYKHDFQKFIDYNIKDVDLVDRLEDKMKLIDMVLALAYDAKVNLCDVFTQVKMWDTLTHNYLYKKNIVVPPKKNNRKDTKYEGAYVKEPVPGRYQWVCSFDLNSLYPHLIMQYNVSPDTIIEGKHTAITVNHLLSGEYVSNSNYCMAANGHYFRNDTRGFLPEMMDTMYTDRSKYKNLMIEWQKKKEKATTPEEKKHCDNKISKYSNLQLAKKVQLNSAYGAIGNQWFRFYDVRQAEAITLSGQLSIRWIENKMNGYLNKLLKTENVDYVIASDTDSIYVNLGPLVDAAYKGDVPDKNKVVDFLDTVCENKLQKFIDKSYQELADYMNAYDQKMIMKREVIADTGIWTAKKRYILNVYDSEGVRYTEPKLKMMGIEAVKSSTPMSCRDKIKEALQIVMVKSESELHSFVCDFENEFKTLPFEDVAFPRGVSELSKYSDRDTLYKKATPIHVRGSLVYNDLIKKHNLDKRYELIKDGEKIKFCYMKLPNPTHENVLSIVSVLPKKFELDKYLDYDLQFEKAFVEPLNNIVNTFGWTTKPVSNLKRFFKK